MNHFIAMAVAEILAALLTEEYLGERAARRDRAACETALSLVPDVEPAPEDRLPS